MKKTGAAFFVIVVLAMFQACKREPDITAEQGEEYSGGAATVFSQSSTAFGQPISGLSSDDRLFFFVGNSFFRGNWVTSPASTTARDGLGPLFQARSCSSCHLFDGRGKPPVSFGGESVGLLLRLSVPGTDAHGGPMPDPVYGDQLQDNSIPKVAYEGKFDIAYSEEAGTYPDGTTYSLRKPGYNIHTLQYGAMAATQVSPRVGQQIIGLGLLGAVQSSTIIAFADESDASGDGISGKVNYVWDEQNKATVLGRFGWKANQPTVFQQVCGAFLGDLGITTHLFPNQNCNATGGCDTMANGGTPEIDEDDLQKVVLYCNTLAVPARRDWKNEDVLKGKQLFTNAGCTGCHIPKMETGSSPISASLSNQTIRPYTDLLLHDMGAALADGRPDFLADGNEWRTQPLWGIGLINAINNHQFLLHDGRARNIEEAILWHGGEAEKSKNNFKNLSKADRERLLQFVNSL